MLVGEEVQCIMGVIRNKNTPRGRDAEVFSVTAGRVYSNHFASKISLLTLPNEIGGNFCGLFCDAVASISSVGS
jgi:hypothetical protein